MKGMGKPSILSVPGSASLKSFPKRVEQKSMGKTCPLSIVSNQILNILSTQTRFSVI